MHQTATLLRSVLPPAGLFVDVGVCDGYDTQELADAFPQARILGFEGLQENYERYLLPRQSAQVQYQCLVVGAVDATVAFHVQAANGLHSLYDRGRRIATRAVMCRRLDTILPDAQPCFLKIDVEGATLDVLEGAPRCLQSVVALHVETEDVPYFAGQRGLDVDVARLLDPAFVVVAREAVLIGAGHQYETVWVRRTAL